MNRISFFSATAAAVLGFLLAAMGSSGSAILIWVAIALIPQSQRLVDIAQAYLTRRARQRARMLQPRPVISFMNDPEVRE